MPINATIKTKTPCEVLLDITVGAEDVTAAYERTVVRLGKQAELPGFRIGKAPRPLLEQQFKKVLRSTTLEDLSLGIIRAVVKKHALKPITSPELDKELEYPDDGPLQFAVSFEIEPTVRLKNYSGLALSKRPVTVASADVDKTIDALLDQHATFAEPTEPRAAQFGDWLVVDYIGRVDGQEVMKRENAWTEVSSNSRLPVPGFGEQLAGMKNGETQEITVTAPTDYFRNELAGKTIVFSVTCRQLQERRRPLLDDEFVKKLNPNLTSVQALRDDIEKNHKSYGEANEQRRVRDLAAEALVRMHDVPLPPSALQSRTRRLVESEAQRRLRAGEKEDEIKKQIGDVAKQLAEVAAMQLRSEYILHAIAEAESIAVTEEDIQPQLQEYAEAFRRDAVWVRRMLERDGHLDALYEEARARKALEWVVAHAVITEK